MENKVDEMETNNDISMSRRNLLIATGAITSAALAGQAIAGSAHQHGHKHGGGNNNLVEASLTCIKTGQACINHCLAEFKKGNTDMADCAAAVQEMVSLCSAFSNLASLDSKHLATTAKACIDVCDSCVKECKKHEKDHMVCKDCRMACEDCIKEMKKVA